MNVKSGMVAVSTLVLTHWAASDAVVTRDIGCQMMPYSVKVNKQTFGLVVITQPFQLLVVIQFLKLQ